MPTRPHVSPLARSFSRILDRELQVGISLLAVLLVIATTIAERNIWLIHTNSAWVAHTRTVLELTSQTLLTVVDAETGQRGFLITGRDDYLAPYHDALARLDAVMARLRNQTRDNPQQQVRIQALDTLITRRLALLRDGIELRRANPAAELAMFSTGRGRIAMDAIRAKVTLIEREEQSLLFDRERRSERAFRTAVASILVSALLGLVALAGLVVLMRRSFLERRKAAAALHEQREWFSTTLASIGDAVIATDTEGNVVFANTVAQSLTGWDEKDALGLPLDQVFVIVNERTRSPVDNPALRALRVGQIVGLANHTVLISRSGEERPIDDSASPIRDQSGHVIGAVLVFRDITARRRDEQERHRRSEQLAETQERTRAVIDNAIDGLITIDEQGTVSSFNPAAVRLFGYQPDEVIGQNVKMLMPEPYHGSHDGYLRRYRETGEAKIIGVGREVSGRRRDGSIFPMDLAVSEFRLGARRFFVGIVRDITERRRLETELRARADELATADRRKNEFLATLAHELRNPIAPILNAVAVLRAKGPPAPELVWAREVIHRQGEYMARLLDDLLDVSRLSRNRLQLRRRPVTLTEVLERAVETSRPLIDAAGHRFTMEVPEVEVWLDADPVRVTQSIANLLNNAARYTDAGGSIALIAVREGSDVVITVRDTGIGIAVDQLPRVFDIFSQAAPALERSQGGLGIGLSLVRSIVQMHGGSIEARSAGIGQGSEFIVRLPLMSMIAGSTERRQTEEPEPADHAPLRILVSDDNPDAVESLGMILRIVGHEVHLARDGVEAVELARTHHPDVAVIDIGMPKLNGYEVARRIRAEPWGESVTLVALTGWGQDEDRQRATEAGFDHHLVKPVEFPAMRELLRRIVLRR